MVMEFWIGWFDFWGNEHATKDTDTMTGIYKRILTYPASVNIYMFHGGTNFGFTNGASLGTYPYGQQNETKWFNNCSFQR